MRDGERTCSRRALLGLLRPTGAVRTRVPEGRAWVASIAVGRCSDCAACVRVCRPGALERRAEGEGVAYTFDARTCSGCGQCARVCAEGAVSLARAGTPTPEVALETVARLSPSPCVRCGVEGVGRVDGACPSCRTGRAISATSRGTTLPLTP